MYLHGFIDNVSRLNLYIFYVVARARSGGSPKTVVFYPEKPQQFHELYHLMRVLGYRVSNNLSKPADLVVSFEDITIRHNDPDLSSVASRRKVINYGATDISKTHVDQVFSQVFKYSSLIDPRTFKGKAVMKSDLNGRHDGKIVDFPRKPKTGYIYQKLIRTDTDQTVIDIRVLICGESIPFVYFKYHPNTQRFESSESWFDCHKTEDVFSPKEISLMLKFAKNIGLDFGELDVLRDVEDGRIYIVDANNTPSRPPVGFSIKHQLTDTRDLAKAFERTFIKLDTQSN